ncbi:MAG TPA: FHA domain-containing protein, partial [Anaerolineales bacterium]|nr:FHA domain-containing protein [Anaerolineales bacterium]
MSERTAARVGSSDRTQDLPVLIAQTGKLNGSRWVLEGAQTLIGRGAECGLVIPDRQVSRVHARIVHSPEGYYLEDLGSKNGTHVNGEAVEGR